jgi:aerobic-type carbon monoxide dehydrogenase small subunit (CoxS/CutS family)
MAKLVRFMFNGKPTALEVQEDRMFLWVVRTEIGLTGTKFGCGEGFCGTCTVLVDGKPERSCQLPMRDVAGKKIVTIEGLAKDGNLHPVQAAFVEHDALQCGFCTPGMILSAYSLLLENPAPTRQQIFDHMEDNLCRCGAHLRIVKAIETAAAEMRKGVQS